MNKELVREIAQRGGNSPAKKGERHRFTPETAAIAGSKGGTAMAARPGHMKTLSAAAVAARKTRHK